MIDVASTVVAAGSIETCLGIAGVSRAHGGHAIPFVQGGIEGLWLPPQNHPDGDAHGSDRMMIADGERRAIIASGSGARPFAFLDHVPLH
jgi:hypothetical protein